MYLERNRLVEYSDLAIHTLDRLYYFLIRYQVQAKASLATIVL